ncbi:DNA glycosylase AlkZ-like family protein, partial [Rhodospirillum rubrum]
MGPRALSALEARRIALRAQGFGRARPPTPSPRHLDAVTRRLGLVQMDSINVLARAHAMPAFSRLGPYDKALLETASYDPRRRTLFEYWGHEASLIRLELQPALRWRMEDARAGLGLYSGLARFAVERRAVIDGVLAALAAHGPASARDLDPGQKRNGAWWGWGETKAALEWLFWGGLVTTLRRRGFERVYDLTERALPASVLARPTP